MLNAKLRRLIINKLPVSSYTVFLILCFSAFASSSAQPADEAARLHSLADKFFAAYIREDMNALVALWGQPGSQPASQPGSDFAAAKASLEQTFAAYDRITLQSLAVRGLAVDGTAATLRMVVEINAVDAKTGAAAQGFGKMNRTFHCVKEGGEWKIARYEASEEGLAAALVTAKSEEERRLLVADRELITVELRRALISYGDRLRLAGDYAQTLTTYRLAQTIAEQIGDKAGIASALHSIGTAHWRQGDFAQALECFQKSLTLNETLGNKSEVADTVHNIGNVHWSQGNYAQALEYYQKSLALREALGDKKGVAHSLGNIGLVNWSQGSYAQALEKFQKSLVLLEEVGDKTGIARALGHIANTHTYQGNYAEALQYHQKSLALREALGDKVGIGFSLGNIGSVHNLQSNYAEALRFFQKAVAQYKALGDKAAMVAALHNIGEVYKSQGNYAQALEYYRQSLTLSEVLGDRNGIAGALDRIGDVYYSQSNFVQALEYLQKSLTLHKTMDAKADIAIVLHSIGNVHKSQGNYAQALEYMQQSLALSETSGSKSSISLALNGIGLVHFLQGQHAQAVKLTERAAVLAAQIGDPENLLYARTTAGAAYRALKQPEQARRAFAEAIAATEKIRQQVAGGEQEQQRFFEGNVSPYYEMVDLLVEGNNIPEALAYAEQGKGRVLLDVLRSGKVDITKAMTPPEQNQERQLTAEITSLNTQIRLELQREQPNQSYLAERYQHLHKAQLAYEGFRTNLYAAHPELRVRRAQVPTPTLDQLSSLLPDSRSALLEFVVMDERTHLFVLTRNDTPAAATTGTPAAAAAAVQLRVYPLNVKRTELVAQVERFRQQLAQRNLGFRDSAQRLYQLLLQPAHAQLHGKTTLGIVPDGVLWELPFQALQSGQTNESRYLIEDAAIFYAPSLSVLREMARTPDGSSTAQRNPASANASANTGAIVHNARLLTTTSAAPSQQRSAAVAPLALLAFGNPALRMQTVARARLTYRNETFSQLPEAEREVRTLQQLYRNSAHTRVYTGTAADEAKVKAEIGNYRILHFATHGILDDHNPMYSHLLLSHSAEEEEDGARHEDGLLQAWEIMQLDLQADLAVLSACQTARGRIGAGEGVIGMTWALFVAGCPSTVVSQWKVDSASTTELMVEFHRHLVSRSATSELAFAKAEALRQAQLRVLKNNLYRHPFYWAGFVLVGTAQ